MDGECNSAVLIRVRYEWKKIWSKIWWIWV